MSVNIVSGQELKEKLQTGINKLADAVTATMGSSGRPVGIRDSDGTIRITKDGYSVANAISSFEDPAEDFALQLGKTVSKKTVDAAGDGTTTSTLLLQSFVNESFQAITPSTNVVDVQRGINQSVKAVVEKLKEMAVDVVTEEQMLKVAQLSANGDEYLARLIVTALDKAGEEGVVTIEESRSTEDSVETVEGMVMPNGVISQYFFTDHTKAHTLLSKPYVFIVNDAITRNDEIVHVLEYVAEQGRPLLLIADRVEGEALTTLVLNATRGNIKIAVVKSPDFDKRRTAILEDIAILTGGQVISELKGYRISKLTKEDFPTVLGECRTSTSTKDDTVILDGAGKVEDIETRMLEIKAQIETSKSAYERENLQARLSKLTGGVSIIHVGGISEVEMKEKRDRVDDALHATKAAISEGIVPGGGLALINCESVLNELVLPNKDQELGKEIVRKTLYAPFKKILLNAGIDNHYEILAERKAIVTGDITWNGYNVKTGEYGNLQDMGIIDPVKVTRHALENAASVASVLITTTASVFESKKEQPQVPAGY